MTKSEVAEKIASCLVFFKTPQGSVLDPWSDVYTDCKWNHILLKHIKSLVENDEERQALLWRAWARDHWLDSLPQNKP
jgi:hypothetical protein